MTNRHLNSQKVVIIGAGIIGLYLAWKLSEKGHRVTVFEKGQQIGKTCCSGLFSERILGFIPESKTLIQNQIESVLVHFPKKTINVKFSKKFLVMSHSKLDKLVASLAEKAGAKIILNHPINSLPEDFDRIIGCDGPNSFIRKSLKLLEPNFRLGGQRFILEENFSNYVEVWPIKKGFSWKIPRGNQTEYGVIGPFKSIHSCALEQQSFALIPQGLIIPKNNKITLCGDAAGLTKPWSGGGVIWGLTAAEILLRNFPNFLKYRQATRRFFLPQIFFSKMALRIVYFLGFNFSWILPKKIKMEGDFLRFIK